VSKMITFRYFDAFNSGVNTGIDQVYMTSATKSKVVCVDEASGNHLVVKGQGLEVENGVIRSGIITGLVDTSPDNEAFFAVENLNIDSRLVDGTSMESFFMEIIQRLVDSDLRMLGSKGNDTLLCFEGDDRIVGGRGADAISGGKGQDMLIGGFGKDTFEFFKGYGRDTVRDFDADGSDGSQDFIKADYAMAKIKQSGDHTVINFGDGDVLRLLNVDADQVEKADFIL
jgi:Ca2+-binding RTX toxin-like protein